MGANTIWYAFETYLPLFVLCCIEQVGYWSKPASTCRCCWTLKG